SDGSLQVSLCPVQLTGFSERHSKKRIRFPRGGVETFSGFQFGECPLPFSRVPKCNSKIVMCLPEPGLQGDSSIQVFERYRQLTFLAKNITQEIMGFGIGGVRLYRHL